MGLGIGSVFQGIAGITGAAISAVGASKANDQRRKGLNLINSIMEEYGLIDMPDFTEFKSKVDQLVANGTIDPYTQISILQKDADGRAAVGDPSYIQAQNDTLKYFNEVVSQGGMTDIDRAAYYNLADQIEQTMRAGEQNILANAQQRGVAGGGMELAAKMQQSQNIGTRAARAGVDLLANNQARRDAAATAWGNLGIAARNQAFSEAEAGDRMFQSVVNQNTQLGFQGAQAKFTADQQTFNNEMAQTGARASLVGASVNQRNTMAAGTSEMYGGFSQALNSLGAAGAKSLAPAAPAVAPAAAPAAAPAVKPDGEV